jgi:hypothetical protein
MPSLWYYDDFLFLTDKELPRQSVSSFDSPKDWAEISAKNFKFS